MSATPRSNRLSSPGQVVAILAASVLVWFGILTTLVILFIDVFIPAFTLGGKSEIPGDFPVYPGSHLQTAVASSFSECTTVSATWTAASPVGSVVAFYKSGLAQGPWSLTDSREQLGELDLYFESTAGPRRDGIVMISAEPYDSATTVISLQLSKSKGGDAGGCQLLVVGIGR